MNKAIQPAAEPFEPCEALLSAKTAYELIAIAQWLIADAQSPEKALVVLDQALPKAAEAVRMLETAEV
jgi:hypothetical protein